MQQSSTSTRVYFGLEEQTVDALELTLESLRRVPSRMDSWKWAIIGMHAALQGSFAVALRRTDGAQVLIPVQEKQFWERVERERESGVVEAPIYITSKGKPQDEKVDWFLDLFTKTQDAGRMQYMAGVPLQPTPAQTESIEQLHWCRGHLIHFGSTGLSLDALTLLDDMANGLDIIETLLTRTQHMSDEVHGGPIDTMANPEHALQVRELIVGIRSELMAVRDRYSVPEPEGI